MKFETIENAEPKREGNNLKLIASIILRKYNKLNNYHTIFPMVEKDLKNFNQSWCICFEKGGGRMLLEDLTLRLANGDLDAFGVVTKYLSHDEMTALEEKIINTHRANAKLLLKELSWYKIGGFMFAYLPKNI